MTSSSMEDPLALPSASSAWKGEVSKSSEAVLREAYSGAIDLYKTKLTNGEFERIWADGKSGINDVQMALKNAKDKFTHRKARQSKARQWVTMFSIRLMYYKEIMDTLAQHHPEYVSLAWGTIKFLFVAVLNHEESIARLSKAFAMIADALPRAKLKLELYTTEAIKEAVAQLYAHIMRFSQRAIKWYTESPMRHMYHSITQPFFLEYKDIVDEVAVCSSRIEQLAADAAQAEQRDIHILLRNLNQICISQNQSILTSGVLNTPFQLRNIEVSQILAFVDKTPLPASETTLAYHLAIRNRRLKNNPGYLDILHGSAQLRNWASSNTSNIIIIRGSFSDRGKTRDLAASIVAVIKKSQRPVIWALALKSATTKKTLSSLDILKHLVLQILQLNKSLLQDHSRPLNAIDFQCAKTEAEWFELLSLVLVGIPEIYIIIDIDILRRDFDNGQTWPASFTNLFKQMAARSKGTVIKVVLLSNHAQLRVDGPGLSQKNVLSLSKKGRKQGLATQKSSRFRVR